MRLRAFPAALATVLALGVAAPVRTAEAGNAGGQLGVSVVVRPSRPAPSALDALPLPPGAHAMTASRFGGSYRYAGAVAQATGFYHAAMQQLGYRLASRREADRAATQVWERADARVELEFRQALGTQPTTRIVITASATEAG